MRAPIGVLTVVGSFAFTSMVLANAYMQKKQFYPSVVYITKSNPSMAVLYIQAFVFVIMFAKLISKIFFGQLRAVELEHLIERSWYAVTETCLAFTVFRDDFSTKFVVMFTLLLFLKCFHWLAEDRVDYMESSPLISWLFHLRAISLISVLGGLDLFFIQHAYHSTLAKGASVQLVFGFEYAILSTVIAAVFIKYCLHVIDLQSEIAWDNKAVYLLYTELLLGGVKVVLYSAFMVIMIKVHTFPLFAIRPMYLTIRSFKKALNDVVMSRRAIRNMNTLYPDATPEDLASGDNVCIICREEMSINCKKLPCNHIFHTSCLRSWFQRQQTCPTCRMDVLRPGAAAQTSTPAQPQPQQQHQHQQAAGPFPGFPFWPPPGGLPPPPPATPTPGATPAGTPVPPVPPMPPFMMNPFMMPPPPAPFTTPFPVPSGGDLGGLTDQELQDLEGRERRNVEARIRCLRNIQTLLDAAVLQMSQYSNIVAGLSDLSPPTTIGADASTPTRDSGAIPKNKPSTPKSTPSTPSGGTKPKSEVKTSPVNGTRSPPSVSRVARVDETPELKTSSNNDSGEPGEAFSINAVKIMRTKFHTDIAKIRRVQLGDQFDSDLSPPTTIGADASTPTRDSGAIPKNKPSTPKSTPSTPSSGTKPKSEVKTSPVNGTRSPPSVSRVARVDETPELKTSSNNDSGEPGPADGSEGAVGYSPTSVEDVIDPSSFDDSLIDQGDMNEIRRRRLHRFSVPDASAPSQ